MEFVTAYKTDIGIKKATNQDALAIKTAVINGDRVLMAVLCDGMGGLEKGEVASKEVIDRFSFWFSNEFASLLITNEFAYKLEEQWKNIILEENQKIRSYGTENNVNLGTTVTVLLLIGDSYYIVHVGDSRVYEFSDCMYQLTEDQTVVAREINAGRLTEEQAELDPRRNILLQCVGASEKVEPAFYQGKIKQSVVFMLCSDGLRHKCSSKEMWDYFNVEISAHNEKMMKENIEKLITLVKQREENDNISCILISTIR